MKHFVKSLLVAILVVGLSAGAALAGGGVCVNNSLDVVKPVGLITLTDIGWSSSSGISDCVNGWSDDWWSLTLTHGADVTIAVDDCCCPGDLFEVWIDDCMIGQTPQPVPYLWGCEQSGPLASGKFTVSLQPGTYVIKVRDFAFDAHQPLGSDMCPAGYSIDISLGAYTGIPWPCDSHRIILDQLSRIRIEIALLEAKNDNMESKLENLGQLEKAVSKLGSAITVIEVKNDNMKVNLDHLEKLPKVVAAIESKNDRMEVKLDSLANMLKRLQESVTKLEVKLDKR